MFETGPHTLCRQVASEVQTLGDMFCARVQRSDTNAAFYHKTKRHWHKTTWRQWYARSAQVAQGLIALDLAVGERVAILGPTQPEWAIYDMGGQLAGLVTFGIYPKQSVEQMRYLLGHSDARVVFVDGEDELTRMLEAVKGLDTVRAIVPWSQEAYEAHKDQEIRLTSPAEFEGDALDDATRDQRLGTIKPDDTAIFVYTSGTTGPPKGAMITHRNILSLLSLQDGFLDLYEDDLSFSFLPMAHAAERILAFYGRISSGVATAYASSIAKVLEEVREVQPTIFGSVPRIFEKAHAKIHSEVEKQSPVTQKIFAWAAQVAMHYGKKITEGQTISLSLKVQHQLADRLVYRKIRAAFGGRVRHFITGAAPIALDILEFFWGAGLPIYEVYGMTEATVVTHANRPGHIRLGTVGQCIEPFEQRLAEDGEILLRGPWVFKGYFKNEEASAKTIVDGWLHTGDIGQVDQDGYLRITDRKKHLIITAGGKNLAPANIEKAIKTQDALISQVHAHGDKRPYVVALIAPSPVETLEFGCARGLVTQSTVDALSSELMSDPSARSEALAEAMAAVVTHPEFISRMRRAVAQGNSQLAQVESVRRFHILDRDFSQEQGELTPTMKVKRKAIETKHEILFTRLYAEEGFAQEPT